MRGVLAKKHSVQLLVKNLSSYVIVVTPLINAASVRTEGRPSDDHRLTTLYAMRDVLSFKKELTSKKVICYLYRKG